ncbi:tlde1 domain-containing protein [Aureimonas psammosilenae]|uniref:tlde1 domain-containing protein n=1 Tax=Aureimonas psammosilenae TaxID=2495496 RepID=UPI001260F59D|nr:tlde1 domain-containing protein [Aureimonas psammosilenae]
MTHIGATLPSVGATDIVGFSSLRSKPAIGAGLACGLLVVALGMGVLPIPAARRAAPPVSASNAVRREAPSRVMTPEAPVPTTARLARRVPVPIARPPVETAQKADRIDLPAHLLAAAHVGDATAFESRSDAGFAMNVFAKARQEAPLEVAAASAPVPSLPVPEPAIRTLEAHSVEAPSIAAPTSAEEALEAALVPTPSARPFYRRSTPIRLSAPERVLPPAQALAYARPDAGRDDNEKSGLSGGLFSSARPGNGVAVYDISAATVFMPNGERLEAHSGLGSLRDDPRFVHQKMRGATPPHVYDLTLRESLFHGVQAIRLNPVGGERRIFNRVGLLAHTYMLGKRGDSNGCVSFKDYNRFLAAFRRGEVRRLVVVNRMSDPVSRLTSLFRRG